MFGYSLPLSTVVSKVKGGLRKVEIPFSAAIQDLLIRDLTLMVRPSLEPINWCASLASRTCGLASGHHLAWARVCHLCICSPIALFKRSGSGCLDSTCEGCRCPAVHL